MTQKPETKIVEKIKDYISMHEGHFLKLYGNEVQRAGEPDLVGSIPVYLVDYNIVFDVHFWVEVKVPGENARQLQTLRLNTWGYHHFAVGVVHSVDEFETLITEFATNHILQLFEIKQPNSFMLQVRTGL